jgi:DNA invertase Pin-like site-specific DNA recombinase
MTTYGYARVSTDGQTVAAQDAQLRAAGCAKVHCETASGAKTDRKELAKVLRRLDAGDVLMVTRLATFRRKIGVFGIAVNGADKAEPAQGGGRGLKISDEWLRAARERCAFPLRGQC